MLPLLAGIGTAISGGLASISSAILPALGAGVGGGIAAKMAGGGGSKMSAADKSGQTAANATAPSGSIVPAESYYNNLKLLIEGSEKSASERAALIDAGNDQAFSTFTVMAVGGVMLLGMVFIASRK